LHGGHARPPVVVVGRVYRRSRPTPTE
jgi:hypothetical protein